MGIKLNRFNVSIKTSCTPDGSGSRLYINDRFVPYVTLLIPDDAALGAHSCQSQTEFELEFEPSGKEFLRVLKNEYLTDIGLPPEDEGV